MVLAPSPSLTAFVCCSGVLYTKFLTTTLLQAKKTFEAGGRSPEDMYHPLAKNNPPQTFGLQSSSDEKVAEKSFKLEERREEEKRWKQIVQNDLESIPLALFVFLGGVLTGANDKVQVGCLVAYTGARVVHTIAYAKKKQPMRAMCFRVGVVSIAVGVVNAVSSVVA